MKAEKYLGDKIAARFEIVTTNVTELNAQERLQELLQHFGIEDAAKILEAAKK